MPLQKIQTQLLEIAYEDEGPSLGPVVFLLHGWPDDARAWDQVAPVLHAGGFRTIAPYFRGFGPTRFLEASTIRDGSGVALAQDVIDLADALGISSFSVAGHDWGARVAYILAGLFPERIHSIATMALAFQPRGEFRVPDLSQSRLFWYQWFMCVEGGAAAVRADPVGFARIQWDTWSPSGWYEEKDFLRTSSSFENPDWVDITLHGYRSRWMPAESDPLYSALQRTLSKIDRLLTPTLVIHGSADSCDEPSGFEGMERYFTGNFKKLLLEGIGHFPPREAPGVVAEALAGHYIGK